MWGRGPVGECHVPCSPCYMQSVPSPTVRIGHKLVCKTVMIKVVVWMAVLCSRGHSALDISLRQK